MSYQINNNEVYEARNSIMYYQNEINYKENEKSAIQKKIDRLVIVRDNISNYKASVLSERNLTDSDMCEYSKLDDWKGNNHKCFISDYNDILINDYNNYYNQVDGIQDTLNNEITRLQNNIYEMNGALGWLNARLNDCWNWLENIIN